MQRKIYLYLFLRCVNDCSRRVRRSTARCSCSRTASSALDSILSSARLRTTRLETGVLSLELLVLSPPLPRCIPRRSPSAFFTTSSSASQPSCSSSSVVSLARDAAAASCTKLSPCTSSLNARSAVQSAAVISSSSNFVIIIFLVGDFKINARFLHTR